MRVVTKTSFAGVFAALALAGGCRHDGPPGRLVPTHAVVLRQLAPYETQCFHHGVWVLRASAADVERWAKENDLPCADDTAPCTHWSSDRRKDLFWKDDRDGVDGLDSVDAKLSGTELTVDFGDYTCGGPFG